MAGGESREWTEERGSIWLGEGDESEQRREVAFGWRRELGVDRGGGSIWLEERAGSGQRREVAFGWGRETRVNRGEK